MSLQTRLTAFANRVAAEFKAVRAEKANVSHAHPYQPASSELGTIAGLSPTDGQLLRRVAGAWAASSLTKADVGLGSVDNTADTAKPVSTAQQTALNAKVDTTRSVTAGTGLTGGGTLAADRSFAVTYGSTAGTAAQGNDARLSDARAWSLYTAGSEAAGQVPVWDTATGRYKPGTVASGGGGSGSGVALPVPTGSATPTITHNLGTTAVDVTVRTTDGTEILVANQAIDGNSVQLTFAAAPPAGLVALVNGATSGDAQTRSDLNAMRTQLFGGASRTQPPACVLYSTSDRTIPNSDVWQDTQWAVSQDTDGIWVPGTVGGGQGYMQIPVAGRYRVRFFALVGGIGLIFYAGKITMNSTVATSNAIASDVVYADNGNGEPFYLKLENNDKTYAAGDKLRFGLWRAAAAGTATCYSNWFGGIFTVASLHWLGPV